MNEPNRVGQTALYTTANGLRVAVQIVDQKPAYGRMILTVTPVAGSGSAPVNEDSLHNFTSSPASVPHLQVLSASQPANASGRLEGSTPDAG